MKYRRELDFFLQILDSLRIKYAFLTKDEDLTSDKIGGIYQILGLSDTLLPYYHRLWDKLDAGSIYHGKDSFFFHYDLNEL